MADERTLATEVREFFESLPLQANRYLNQAIAQSANTGIGSVQFFGVLANVKENCDQLIDDINSSRLKQGSKALYTGAVDILADYLSLESLQSRTTDQLRGETKSFEYLTLVDDVLEPLDNREIPPDFLTKLALQAQTMLDELADSDLEPQLKAFLNRQIEQFVWSINTFKIVGIDGLTRAWGAMAAEIARSQGMQGARKPAAESFYKRALPILGAIGLAVTSVSATVEKTDKLLTHSGHIVAVVTGHDATPKDTPAGTITEVAPE